MKCKFCNAELEEGSTLCPACGKDNAAAEETSAPKMSAGKLTLIILMALVAVAVVAALIFAGIDAAAKDPADAPNDTTASTEATDASDTTTESADPTTATDGNPDDVTCKGSYTVDDDTLLAAKDTVIATVGDAELTVGMLQVYYWMSYYDFVSNYSYYLDYYGLDYTQPLDTQTCFINGGTWQQYFLSSALTTWHRYQALTLEARANGYTLDPETVEYLEGMEESLNTTAVQYGFADAQEMLEADVGVASTVADYLYYRQLSYEGYQYFDAEYQKIQISDEEVETYFTENQEALTSEGITKDAGSYYDVRHILVCPEGGTEDESGTTTYSDDEWAACLVKAQELLNTWLENDPTEESFAALANEHSEDGGSNTNGGLYSGLTTDTNFVEPFKNWYLDESREIGDYEIVQTSHGYHIMYFSGSQPIWYAECSAALMSERSNAIVTFCTDKYPLTVSYSDIVLGFVNQSSES